MKFAVCSMFDFKRIGVTPADNNLKNQGYKRLKFGVNVSLILSMLWSETPDALGTSFCA